MTEEEKKELESLLMELTEGELSSEQSQRLEEVIRQHPRQKQQYLEYCQVHTMLAWEHGCWGSCRCRIFPAHLNSLRFLPLMETIGHGRSAGAGRSESCGHNGGHHQK